MRAFARDREGGNRALMRRTPKHLLSPSSLLLLAACGPEAPSPVVATATPPPVLPPPPTAAAVIAAPPAPPKGPKPKFENPGGMWMPEQLVAQADTLKSLGLEIDPAQLSKPTS